MASNLVNVVRRQFSTTLRRKADTSYTAATAPDSHGSTRTYKLMTFFVALPGVAFCMFNAYKGEMEHKAHSHRPEFVAYSHLRIRNKPFFWGEGNRSLFHNSETNALPEGYEGDE
ncbi:cytochrome c oxidase subunit 6A, mitochondrial-like [Asterias amurensis]|uniref:cytochrome c oxidase subunit 6A, mitochondrial-like n=1 Tax=Asterias amurensis TaxID=7602 RepID=UPI003AB4D313